MSTTRRIVVIGEAPVATLAASIAVSQLGDGHVRLLELTSDRIAGFDAAFLADEPPGTSEVFAAIGPSALNYARFDLWAKLKTHGHRFCTLVHGSANLDPSAELAENVMIGPGAIVEPGARIGRGTFVGTASTIGTGAVLGPWNWISRHASVGAGATVGSHAFIGSGVRLDDHAAFPGPGVLDISDTYRGSIAPGTFLSAEFPSSPARFVNAGS